MTDALPPALRPQPGATPDQTKAAAGSSTETLPAGQDRFEGLVAGNLDRYTTAKGASFVVDPRISDSERAASRRTTVRGAFVASAVAAVSGGLLTLTGDQPSLLAFAGVLVWAVPCAVAAVFMCRHEEPVALPDRITMPYRELLEVPDRLRAQGANGQVVEAVAAQVPVMQRLMVDVLRLREVDGDITASEVGRATVARIQSLAAEARALLDLDAQRRQVAEVYADAVTAADATLAPQAQVVLGEIEDLHRVFEQMPSLPRGD